LIKTKRIEEEKQLMFKKEFKELKEINSQESKLDLGMTKKNSKIK
jgi:hypothetical protein